MCVDNRCGCGSGGGTLGVVAGFVVVGAWWLVRTVVIPAVAVAAVLTGRWLSGARLRGGGYEPAGFLQAARVPVLPALRWGVRVHWRYWPGWQRAVTRWVLTAVAAAAVLAPLVTAVAVAVAVAGVTGGAVWNRRRLRVRLRAGVPIPAVATRRAPLAAIGPAPAVRLSSSMDAPDRERVPS